MTTNTKTKKRKIKVREEVCIGCRLCEIYCIVQHSKSKDIIKAFKEEQPRPLSRVLVEEQRPVSFALQCRHCDDAPCVAACITGAMTKDEETGAVMHDSDKCVGCWMCIMVCPYGAVQRDLSGKKVVSKCDLCLELAVPACVKNCPNEALVLQDEGELTDELEEVSLEG